MLDIIVRIAVKLYTLKFTSIAGGPVALAIELFTFTCTVQGLGLCSCTLKFSLFPKTQKISWTTKNKRGKRK